VSEHPIRLIVTDDLQRSRWTVFLRLLLAFPHYIWLVLWSVVALIAAITNWLGTLLLGRSPALLHRFLAAYVKYVTQLYAYLNLAADPYPSFDGPDGYPVDLVIAPAARQSRWRVALRGLLALPAALLAGVLVGSPTGLSGGGGGGGGGGAGRGGGGGSLITDLGLLHVVALLGWFAILARGRMPRGLRDAAAYGLSYGAQFWGYALLLTDRYPNSDPLAALEDIPERSDPIAAELEDEGRRSRLTVFFRLPLAVPHLVWLALWGILAFLAVIASWFATLVRGRSPEALHRFLSAYVRYQLHVYGFLYLIANPFPGFVGRAGTYPFEALIGPAERQNRWKVAFRIVLVIPAALMSSAYGALAAVAAVLGWFASLATGRMPTGLRNAAALAMRYSAQTSGYVLLLTDSYPYSGPCTNAPRVSEPAPSALTPPSVV
jgi:hypothetical protein